LEHDCVDVGLFSGEIQQHYVRALLCALENDFATVCGDVEVADVEIGREIGQLSLGARIQIDEPEVLMFNFTSEED
jgi:hypothetical protein